jgi:hypothetical protein
MDDGAQALPDGPMETGFRHTSWMLASIVPPG